MPFNGSGVWVRQYNWVNDHALNINITDYRMDADANDFANGLSNCITRDGQGVPTATISWNSQRLSNLGAAVQPNDAISLTQANTTYYRIDGTSLPTVSLNANNLTIINVANPVNPQDAATKSYVDTPTGNRNLGGYQINNLGAGVLPADAVNKAQLDAATGSLSTGTLATIGYISQQLFGGF